MKSLSADDFPIADPFAIHCPSRATNTPIERTPGEPAKLANSDVRLVRDCISPDSFGKV
jgi:hypothetical protein